MQSRLSKLFVAGLTFFVIMSGAWIVGLWGHHERGLPDDHRRPARCMLWFVGSSSVYRWNTLAQDMAPWVAHNRGIEAANFDEILARFSKVSPSEGRPVAIILYAGENDIAAGRNVTKVVSDLARFTAMRDQRMPGVPILALSMKPSPGRIQYFDQQQIYNSAMRHFLSKTADAFYIDATTDLLKDAMPGHHYQADGIHMSASGYAVWSSIVRRSLKQALPDSVLRQCGESG